MEEEVIDVSEMLLELFESNRIGEEELAMIMDLSDRINLNKKE